MICLASIPALAQEVAVPQLSPEEKVEAEIGITKVQLTYSRPSMRGRKIMGGLVPYGKLWRTGANVNTQITLGEAVDMAGVNVPAGTYSIFSIPKQETWTIIIYNELGQYGEPDSLDPNKTIAQFSVPAKEMTRTIESLDIGFDQHSPEGALLTIAWENTFVEIPIKLDTDKIIKERLAKGTQVLADDYASAAWIYYRDMKDVETALAMIDQSISMRQGDQDFETWLASLDLDTYNLPWRHLAKSEMHADLGQFEKAIATAKRSLAIAQAAKSESYIQSNTENIQKWEAKLKP